MAVENNVKLGQQIGIYRLDALLGEGGMGSVYQAYDLNLQRKVALKLMLPRLARNEAFRARFLQEARAAARLDHPSIIRILHFESLPDLLYLVMAYVSGPNLRRYVSHRVEGNEPLPLAEILGLTAQVADALSYAHQQGIVHRDIKPDNLLLQPLTSQTANGEPELRVIVTDFGLAKLQYGGIQTQTGTFMGTLPYMSPEQCKGQELDGRSDLYSLGVVLYQLVTGRLPFDVNSPTEALYNHVNVAPPVPAQLRPGLPGAVNELLLRSLAKEPENRYRHGEEMAEALRAAALELHDWDETTLTPLPQRMTPVPPSGVTRTGGAHLSQAAQALNSGAIKDPSRFAHLLLAKPGENTRAIPMERDRLLIGRGQNCDVRLDDELVSTEHCRLQRSERGWQIVDLNSKNGTFLQGNRLLAGVAEPWEPGQSLRAGRHSLQWRPAQGGQASAVMSQVGSLGGTMLRTTMADIGLTVEPAQVSLGRGEKTVLQVGIQNLGQRVGHFRLTQSGLAPGWVQFSEESVQLMPGAESYISIAINLPKEDTSASGTLPFKIEAQSPNSGALRATVPCELLVRAERGMNVAMQPTQLAVGQTGRIALQNSGNAPTTYKMRGQDSAGALNFDFSQTEATLQPGEKQLVTVKTAVKKRPWVGAAQMVPFTIDVFATDAPDETRQLSGLASIKPLLPSWLVPLLGVALLLVCGISAGGAYAIFGRPEPTATQVAIVPPAIVPPATEPAASTTSGVQPTDEPPAATEPAVTATSEPAATSEPTAPATVAPTATLIPSPTPTQTPTPPAPGPRSLGGGLDDEVRAIAGDGDLVYVGGRFPRGIRLWNQATLQWSELGGGVDGWVNDIAIYDGEVYVTGSFGSVVNGDGSQVEARNVAVWSGSSWQALGGGVSANPQSLAIAVDDEGNVYVGGSFQGPARNVARWLPSEQRWSCLGYDCSLDAGVRYFGNDASGGDYVNEIVIVGDDVYVAGQFSVASEDLNNINVPNTTNLAVWNRVTGRWAAVGGGLVNNVGYSNEIHALAYYDGVLYVGGRFDTAYAFGEYESTSYIAAWDGTNWLTYSNLGNMVFAIAVNENGLYVGGVISQYNDGPEVAGHIARWNGFEWQQVSSGTDDEVLALYTDGVYLYLGGQFTSFAGQDAAYVAGWVEP